ncbi:hypothetical protein FT663_01819 [Candidozyma haemuli var. vulneris]|nr:hypothetical protein FT662_01887 [[Candida] haemuloni var. vulneris]KAF3993651.1 hypothetical protein FT663_01819 [[Candida] haemuloni var. vulneris]
MSFRSFNPALKKHFAELPRPKFNYGYQHFVTPQACQQIIDKLRLKEKYPNSKGNLDVIDIHSGRGMLSTMINYELKPRKHLVIEHRPDFARAWQERMKLLESETKNAENFIFAPLDGYSWATYDELVGENKALSPSFQPRSKVHDELLIVGNVASTNGESLFAQWLMCIAYKNWLHKYGRVRTILTSSDYTLKKFLAGPSYKKRNKTAAKRAMFSETSLVAMTEGAQGTCTSEGYDPRLVIENQPALLPRNSTLPQGSTIGVAEFVPREITDDYNVDEIDYMTQSMSFRPNDPVSDSIKQLAPGAAIDLPPLLPDEILKKTFKELTAEDLWTMYNVYKTWAFKPTYEEMIHVHLEE